MNSFIEPFFLWFQHQTVLYQFLFVALWSFLCGAIPVSCALYLFFQRQKRSVSRRRKEIFGYEKQLLQDRIDSLKNQFDTLAGEKKQQDLVIAELREKESLLRSENSGLEARMEEMQLHTREKLNLLEEAREQLRLQFAELATSILEEKSDRFSKDSEEKFSLLLTPFHEQLASFRHKIDEIHHSETRDRAALQKEISSLRKLNQQMSEEAGNLSRALRGDKKLQGTWGELVLERVLEQSALRKGVEYETQAVFRDAANRFQRPDVIVHLPDGRDIIVDSKVSFVSWEKYVGCDDDRERETHLRAHIKAIREHVKELGAKDYSALGAIRSLDFVLMFMPIEAAFLAAFQEDETLFNEAMSRKVILVGPTTLLTTLKTIESIWHYEKQSRNAREIAEKAAALYDKFCSFTEDMERMGRQMRSLQGSYDSAMTRLSQGRGNLVSRVERFPQMGVKARKNIAKSILARADLDLIADESSDEQKRPATEHSSPPQQ